MFRFVYRFRNRFVNWVKKPGLKNLLLLLSLLLIIFVVGVKGLVYIEKRNWDNRVAELYPQLTYFTYIPNITNLLSLPQTLLSRSELPKYRLEIKGQDFQEILETAPGYLEPLPDKKVYVPATFYDSDKEYEVEVRLRGTISDHWLYRKKSWRVNILDGGKFKGMESFNFIIPEQKQFIVEQYGSFIAQKLGLITVNTEYVRLRVNNGSYGVYWLTEQWGGDLLENHGLSSDANFYSEEKQTESEQLFSSTKFWKKYTSSSRSSKKDFSDLEALLNCLNTCEDAKFFKFIPTILDMDNFYKWQVHTVLLGDDHQDGAHNIHLYFNPAINKFQLIPWDVNRYKFDGQIDILYNPLVGRILTNPDFLHARNQLLWAYVNDKNNKTEDIAHYDQIYDQVKSAFYQDTEKRYSNLFFEYQLADRRAKAERQYDYLKEVLSQTDPELNNEVFVKVWALENKNAVAFTVVANSFSDLALEDVEIDGNINNSSLYYDSNANGQFDNQDELIDKFNFDSKKNESHANNFSQRLPAKRILPVNENHFVEGSFLPTGYERLIEVEPNEHTFFIISGSNTIPNIKFDIINAVTGEEVDTQVRLVTVQPDDLLNRNQEFNIDLKDQEAFGTAPRLEREFKLSLTGNGLETQSIEDLIEGMLEAVKMRGGNQNIWQASTLIDSEYYFDKSPSDFLFRDIYLDTADGLNFRNNISYRLRHRWKSKKKYLDHEVNQLDSSDYPTRSEIQAKVNRQELGDGYSQTEEARFEFREQSEPFSKDNPPPQAPWHFSNFLLYAQSGKFNQYITWPGKTLAESLSKVTSRKTLVFEPSLILLTERQRFHVNIQSPWGSGPNPEQVFIISLDQSEVYGQDYLDYLRGETLNRPAPVGVITEVEIEFERNVSTVLDEQIETNSSLEQTKQAFLDDQQTVRKILEDYLKTQNISLIPIEKSKYVQAYNFVN